MSAMFELKVDASAMIAMGNHFAQIKGKLPQALSTAVKAIGPQVLTAMRGALPGQTGLTSKTINKALKGSMQATAYVIKSHGGDIRLKYFKPEETQAGVSAAPWNHRQVYPATFINSGWWPNRRAPIARGQVLRRKGESKYPMIVVRSGLYIAEEMVKGASASAFYGTIDARFAPAIEAVILSAL
jgi:Tfp pilus tip-associated adhesin PilY1